MFDHIYAAYIFSLLVVIVIMFQLALALGAPWGEMAMGGRFPGKFPLEMRVAALVQAMILVIFAVIVLVRPRLVFPDYFDFSGLAIWFVVVFGALGMVMNMITPSIKERMLWAPIATALFVCAFFVAVS